MRAWNRSWETSKQVISLASNQSVAKTQVQLKTGRDADPRGSARSTLRGLPRRAILFEKQTPTSLNLAITLISPFVPWEGALNDTVVVSGWAAAISAIPYTDHLGQNIIDAPFQIACLRFLWPHIPIEIWRLLKRRPPLHPHTVDCDQQNR